jgi:hypothetical protein
MDPAFLRRIPYKIEIAGPSVDEFHAIFKLTAEKAGVQAPDQVIDEVVAWIGENVNGSLAAYQPKFIIDQMLAASRFAKAPPQFQPQFLSMALSNLHARQSRPQVDDIARIPRARPNRSLNSSRTDRGQYAALSAA